MSDDDKENPSKVLWDDARVASARSSTASNLEVGPGDMAIGTSPGRILVVIRKDGRLEYGSDYRPDEAAEVFWQAMLRRKLEFDEKILLVQHMEALLTQLGAQDLQTEALVTRAREERDPVRAKELEALGGQSMRQLEATVHQLIELGRGLAHRPDVMPPAVPEELPAVVRDDEGNDYQGREGLPQMGVCGECGATAPLGAADVCLECEAKHDFKGAN